MRPRRTERRPARHRVSRRIAAATAAILCGAAVLHGGTAAAQDAAPAQICPTAPAPKLKIVGDILPFTYDHSRPVAGLSGVARTAAATSGHDVNRMLGLTRQSFAVSVNTAKAVALLGPDGLTCVGFSDGTILLRLTTDIFIASELAPDSCLYREVLNHEERHANVGKRLFGEFIATIDDAVSEAVRETPFVETASRDSAAEDGLARLRAIIAPHYRNFISTYRKRQAIIDTSGEYARVAAACPGEMERALRGAGKPQG